METCIFKGDNDMVLVPFTAQKIKFPDKENCETANLVRFTGEMINIKFHLLCSVYC